MVMKKLSSLALAGIALVLASSAPVLAAPHAERGAPAHAPAARFDGRRAIDGHRFEARRFDHGEFHRGFRGGAVIVAPFYWPSYPYAADPGYVYQTPAPTDWYYCPSYGAYYPNVPSCPEPWVPVPG